MNGSPRYAYRVDVGVGEKNKLFLYDEQRATHSSPITSIDLIKLNNNNSYIGKIPSDMTIAGILYKLGDLIYCSGGGFFRSPKVYKVSTITSPRNYLKGEVEYRFAYGKWLGRYTTGNHNKNWYILAEGSTGYDSKGNHNILKGGKWVPYTGNSSSSSTSSSSTTEATTNSDGTSSSISGTSGTYNTSSTLGSSSTSSTGSSTSTDSSTTRSFDFLNNILGTKDGDNEDKPTEIDPNLVANTIVNETKLNDTAVSSLVSNYLNSLYRINRSYNTQTK